MLQKISVIAGESVAESGEYETLFYRAKKYGKLSGIDIRANFHGKSGGTVEIFVRRDISDDWTKLCEFNDKKWIQKRERSFMNNKIGNFSEIQFKIVLKKSQDGKSPLLYELTAEYDDNDTATI